MDALLDIKNVARLLSLSPWTIRRLISDGKLVPVRLGRRVLVEPIEVERFISQARQVTNTLGECHIGQTNAVTAR